MYVGHTYYVLCSEVIHHIYTVAYLRLCIAQALHRHVDVETALPGTAGASYTVCVETTL